MTSFLLQLLSKNKSKGQPVSKGRKINSSFDGVQQGHLTKEQIEQKILLQPSLEPSTFKQGSFCVFFRYANQMIITMIQ